MKIGVSALATAMGKFEYEIDYYINLGLDCIEILHDFPNDEFDIDILNSYDVNYSIHSPFNDVNIASIDKHIRKTSINEIKASIDLANKIDSEIVVIHPGKISYGARSYEDLVYKLNDESFKELSIYANDAGVYPCFENMPNIEGFMYKDVAKLNKIVEEVEGYITLDIGHAHTNGYIPEDLYFDRVKHIHVHDNDGSDDTHITLGEGTFNLNKFFDYFSKNNYSYIYLLELHTKESIKNSLDFMKNL